MPNLTRASEEMFRRTEDERFGTLVELWQHCQEDRERSVEHWPATQRLRPLSQPGTVVLGFDDQEFFMNDWSFSQLCRLANVSKDTLNRLSPETAARALQETMPGGDKPAQVLTSGSTIRSIHGTSYTRLHNVDLLNIVREFATDFRPPQEAAAPPTELTSPEDTPPWEEPEKPARPRGGTGLYCGEQDMFCFLIDPMGWTDIDGEPFAPGFFLWNSEVGRRTVGIQTFWFQAICQNHIVWDAVDIVEFTRKHTANVHDSLGEIRRIIEGLVEKRDQRRDGFVQTIRKAMVTKLGDDADEVLKVLSQHGIRRKVADEALEIARQQGRFTVFALVDALTRLAGKLPNAGERTEADERASSLLALAV
ncbi:MAG: DUF932 domain-containing protein [Planctomycetes bacterium]|nr:DUF932 domain-containing protein [Planctomycetota bacterium]